MRNKIYIVEPSIRLKHVLLSLKCDLVACYGLMTGMRVGIMVVLSTKIFVKKFDSNHLLIFQGKA